MPAGSVAATRTVTPAIPGIVAAGTSNHQAVPSTVASPIATAPSKTVTLARLPSVIVPRSVGVAIAVHQSEPET